MNEFIVEIDVAAEKNHREWEEVRRFESEDNWAHDRALELAHDLNNAGIDAENIRLWNAGMTKPTFDKIKDIKLW